MYAQTRSTIFCDRFYVQTDVFEGKFCAMPNAIKNQYIKTNQSASSIFDGDKHHTKSTFNFLKFYQFSNFELY